MDALQPYNTGDPRGEKLARIRDLNDADKHRTLHVVVGYTGATRVTLTFSNGTIQRGQAATVLSATSKGWAYQRLENDAHLGLMMFRGAIPALRERPGEMHVDVDLAVEVSLDEAAIGPGPAESVPDLLQSFIDLVRHDVTPTFVKLI